MSFELHLLGTGDARRVPVYGCQCLACRRALTQQKYQRKACSAALVADGYQLLIDAGRTDLCETFVPGSIQSILLTHYHMDHVMGLFHLRWGTGQSIPVIGPDDPKGCDDLFKHPGILDFQPAPIPFQPLKVGPFSVTPLPLIHSKPVYGYGIECQNRRLAYLTDTVGLPDDTLAWLQQHRPDVMVLDCSMPPKPSRPRNHNDLNLALELADAIQPAQTLLTHIGHQLDAYLMDNPLLPEGISVAWDDIKLTL